MQQTPSTFTDIVFLAAMLCVLTLVVGVVWIFVLGLDARLKNLEKKL